MTLGMEHGREQIPDRITARIGYRVWRSEGNTLLSQNLTEWTPGEPLKAICSYGLTMHMYFKSFAQFSPIIKRDFFEHPGDDTESPVGTCSCGIYARNNDWGMLMVNDMIVGTVWLWGKIILHTEGFRAQYAYPRSFVKLPTSRDPHRIALAYDVPVENPSLLNKIKKIFG